MPQVTADAVMLWSARRLEELVPGSTRKLWLTRWIPDLVRIGVLCKAGKAWLGRRSSIEAALLSGKIGVRA